MYQHPLTLKVYRNYQHEYLLCISESIAKAKETKKKNGTTGHGRKLPLESYKKGWETRRKKKESIQ